MTVRRLAEQIIQPDSFGFTAQFQKKAKKWIAQYPECRQQSAVVPLLMLAQEQEGWVSMAAIKHVAAMLKMAPVRVLEVASFYTQFHLSPVGTCAHVQVCGTTPCMLRGSEGLKEVCRSMIHPLPSHMNEEGTLSWEEVECLGACVNAPLVMIGKDTYEDLVPERLSEIISLFRTGKGKTVLAGPQVTRFFSAPQCGLTSLAEEKKTIKKIGRIHRKDVPIKSPED